MKRQKTLLSPGGWTALLLLRGGLTGAAAAGQQAKGQRQGQQQSK